MMNGIMSVRSVNGVCESSPRPKSTKWHLATLLVIVSFCSVCGHVSGEDYMRVQFRLAVVNITYKDPVTGDMVTTKDEIARYGQKSRLDPEWGVVVHVRSEDNKTHGCAPPVNIPKERWIALIKRGSCKFTKKIHNHGVKTNASAVVIYNNKTEDDLLTMENTDNVLNVQQVVAIFMNKHHGEKIAALVDNGTRVMMTITAGGTSNMDSYNSQVNKTSILFVSISFIVLMIISLAWLVFYYIQRFRYAHAKERLSKRLMHAAKKAISKMPARTIKSGDKELDADFDQCAICIEGYKVSEVIRILPCKHVFHKSCVDPWLIEQRSCPMCKTDILMAYGLQIHGSRESIVNIEVEGPSTSLGPFEIITSEGLREFDHNGVEVIRFQPTHVDYHNAAMEASIGAISSATSDVHAAVVTSELAVDRGPGAGEPPETEQEEDRAQLTTTTDVHDHADHKDDISESSNLLQRASTSMESLECESSECQLLVRKDSTARESPPAQGSASASAAKS